MDYLVPRQGERVTLKSGQRLILTEVRLPDKLLRTIWWKGVSVTGDTQWWSNGKLRRRGLTDGWEEDR